MTMKNDEFTCDIIFIFKEFQMKESQEVLEYTNAVSVVS